MLTSKAGSSGSSSGCALAGSDSAGFVSSRGASFCAGGCVGAEVGFCGSGSSGCGADETGFVFSVLVRQSPPYRSALSEILLLLSAAVFRIRFLPDSRILPEQTGWQECPRLIHQPMLYPMKR